VVGHVIVGAGAVGTATAQLLVARGERVRIVSRRGGGPEHPSVERVAADAADADRLAALAAGATALYNCANPQYHRWFTDWPPLAAALLAAAERTGAVLATVSNLYGYGEVTGPITADTALAATHPKLRLRADLWRAALAAHQAGRIRATEVRGSDYVEANSIPSLALGDRVLAGRRVFVPVPLDVIHSVTSITDVARTLVTVAADQQAWGRAWLVPSNPPRTLRQLATRYAELGGAPRPKLTSIPYPVLWAVGRFSPTVRELAAVRYQFTRPFVLDAAATTAALGIAPTPLDQVLGEIASRAGAGRRAGHS
jgi:nucleoside-diphosphate-sugar epimerase